MLTFGWRSGEDPDEGQVFSAVQLAFWDRPHWQADPHTRAAQQAAISQRHEQLYADLLARVEADPAAVVGCPETTGSVCEPAAAP
jgi:hypothetical protein